MAIIFIGWLVLMLFGVGFEEAYSVVISSLGNVGPGIGKCGPSYSWSGLPDAAKWTSAILMLKMCIRDRHQAYGHKILTGRRDAFCTNRKLNGIRDVYKRQIKRSADTRPHHQSTRSKFACRRRFQTRIIACQQLFVDRNLYINLFLFRSFKRSVRQ